MPTNNQCKIEFYFSRDKIESLLKENPKAKGIIISQEIKVRVTADNEKVNVIEIKARADNGSAKTRSANADISGCPYPPGCGTGGGTEADQ